MNEAQLFHHSAWQTFDLDPVDPVNPCHSSAMAVVAVDVTAKHWYNMAAGNKKDHSFTCATKQSEMYMK